MHKVHKNVIMFCSALSLAILSATLMIATRNDSSTDVQLPALFSLDSLNNRTLISEPSYTEWGKVSSIAGMLHFSLYLRYEQCDQTPSALHRDHA